MGKDIGIDETALSNGELYTIVTNKAAKGRKGSLIAMIKGTESKQIIEILRKISYQTRCIVREISLDMAATMNKIAKKSFPKASIVIDRFHVQKLAYEAVQDVRIAYRWEAISRESQNIQKAKQEDKKYKANPYSNGDTEKQLLARSRYLLFKSQEKWSQNQKNRATILFENFPKIKQAYDLASSLRRIYSKTKDKSTAYTKLAHWYREVEEFGDKNFRTVSNSIFAHYQGILNFFDNRTTNASAESFNAKIKAFRSTQRGVRDIPFFLFRLSNIYA
jgi:transposase